MAATRAPSPPRPDDTDPRILVISPVRNESRHIERVVRSVVDQELLPARWIVTDDGSCDETVAILRRLEPEVEFMQVLELPPASSLPVRDRLAVAAEVRAFSAGLTAAGDLGHYTHVMKLDGDIALAPEYLRVLMERFRADPTLGLGGGVLQEPTPRGAMRPIRISRDHVHGALKCYSRRCFEAIGGVQERLAWDTVDEVYARMLGFGVRSFPDLVSEHLRPIGSADGRLRGHARHGECAYISHFPPVWVLARAVKIMSRPPYGLSGIAFLAGYAWAAARRRPQIADAAYRRFVRRGLRRRVVRAVRPDQLTARARPGSSS